MIVAGHARVVAAKQLGLKMIPTILVDHLTEDQIRAYILADNRIAENAGWDPALLRVELEHLARIDIDVDVELTGFSMSNIDVILNPPTEVDVEEPPPPPPDIADTVTRAGDVWRIGPHRVICGDTREPEVVSRLMEGNSAGMLFPDPPYNVRIHGHVCGLGKTMHSEFFMASGEMTTNEFIVFLVLTLRILAAVCIDGSLHYLCIDWRHTHEMMIACEKIYDTLINLCVWAKTNAGMGSLYRSQHELVFVYKKGLAPHVNNVELGKHGRYRTNVWTYPGLNSFGKDRDESLSMHPTVKPIAMVRDAILDASKRGDIILDGFLGSGTTLLAAEQTGRICHGIEIDPRYVDVALRRWMDATGGTPIHADSGIAFPELASARGRDTTCEG
jgi:DNA modification methylase